MSGTLAAVSVLLAFCAAWELAGALEGRLSTSAAAALSGRGEAAPASIAETALRLGIPGRLERAGLADRVGTGAVLAAKVTSAVVGALVAAMAAPAAPARLAPIVALGLVVAASFVPDALLERRARRRRERFVGALPEALDMLAVSASSGRSPATALAEIAAVASGPLGEELEGVAAAVECGSPPRSALGALRRRIPGKETAALAAALERSRSHGSPLSEQLHLQAASLRRDARRRIEERAARAAPKIQLVVALVLVPSVLLMIAAAILAHSDALFGAF